MRHRRLRKTFLTSSDTSTLEAAGSQLVGLLKQVLSLRPVRETMVRWQVALERTRLQS